MSDSYHLLGGSATNLYTNAPRTDISRAAGFTSWTSAPWPGARCAPLTQASTAPAARGRPAARALVLGTHLPPASAASDGLNMPFHHALDMLENLPVTVARAADPLELPAAVSFPIAASPCFGTCQAIRTVHHTWYGDFLSDTQEPYPQVAPPQVHLRGSSTVPSRTCRPVASSTRAFSRALGRTMTPFHGHEHQTTRHRSLRGLNPLGQICPRHTGHLQTNTASHWRHCRKGPQTYAASALVRTCLRR